ncbi:MFS transporter [Pseudomonas mediterranea]|uniref:Drug resistance transporter, EmrB/QacA subfamily n=1 Tax=Pseudomonas mediterranea TaxID=183795 RepID=A0AAX2DDW5_9PSED|nr:MFS transporter [Pseudomonas mediterranea]KGU83361.1 MFS transporter [Pseudomonas mediterranea CFBP 5447]MBL0841469.1 MFS transporter [Pseudomonas mediterranea]QHA82676.1 MFS transporter [Pseudomonas mediterranea]UZE03509.1 MFS transporter [Pseudomonas mediterranea]CAH0149358.1 Riboflavin transporter RibZ [Pseudomonas mediterranea]
MKPTHTPPDSTGVPQPPSSRWALTSLALATLLASLGTSVATVGLPALAEAFNASFQAVQWVVLAYLLAISTLIVSVGRLGDLVGRRQLLLAGILLFTLASVLCGFAPSLGLLIAGRTLQGLGAAVMMALTMALVGETVDKDRTGRAMGLLATLSAVGTALGPSLGGTLVSAFGWHAIFLVNVPLGLLTWLLAWRSLPIRRPQANAERPGFDITGTVLLATALGAYALAMTLGRGNFGGINIALLLMAILGGGLFVLSQRRVTSPLIPLALFRDRLLVSGLATSALVATVMMATLLVGPFYLSISLGLPTTLVGLVLAVGPCVAALAGVPAGRLADRFGVRPMRLAGLATMVLGCSALALLSPTLGMGGYVMAIVITTLGYALFQTANNTAVMADIAAQKRGVIAGLLNLSRNLGFFTGASVLGAVFASALPTNGVSAASPGEVANGLHFTFAAALSMVVLALFIALQYRAPEPLDEHQPTSEKG